MKKVLVYFIAMFAMSISSSAQINIADGIKLNVASDGYLIVNGDFKVATGGQMNVLGKTTIGGIVINNGDSTCIRVEANGQARGSLIQYSANVKAQVECYLNQVDFHYISSPVTNQVISPVFVDASTNPLPLMTDFYKFDEPSNLWRNIKDASGNLNSNFETEMVVNRGYVLSYSNGDFTKAFSGPLNHASQSVNLTKTPGSGSEGWNLVGNPFPASIAINSAANSSAHFLQTNGVALDNAYEGIYFWDGSDYVTVNQVSDACYVAPCQGFFVKAATNNETMLMKTSFQKHADVSSQPDFFKTPGTLAKFTMGVTGPLGDYNQITFAFVAGKTTGLDPGYDSQKLKGNANLALYSKLISDNSGEYMIQTLPDTWSLGSMMAQLGLDAWQTGEYTFSDFEMINIDPSFEIYLVDDATQTWTNCHTVSLYTVNLTTTGTYQNRFYLNFSSIVTSISETTSQKEEVQIYSYGSDLFVTNHGTVEHQGRLLLYNGAGQLIYQTELELLPGAQFQKVISKASGIYEVSFIAQDILVQKKVFIQ